MQLSSPVTDGGRGRREQLAVDAALIALIFIAMVGYVTTTVPDYFHVAHGGDYPHYVAMARAPLTNDVPSPWRYRLLNPALASLLIAAGVPTDVAFLTLTVVFGFISCLLMQWYLERLGLSTYGARAGALLFAVSVGGFIPLRRYYGYTDALTNCFILVILLCLTSRRYVATAVSLGVGTLAKESILLLVPFVAARLHAARTRLWLIVAILAVPIALFVLLRLVVPPDVTGSAAVALTWQEQVGHWRNAMIHGVARWVLWAFAYSMGPVWVLAVLAVRNNWAFVRESALLLLPLVAPLLRTTDTDRALMLAFPVVFPLGAFAVDRCREASHRGAVLALAVGCTWGAQLTFAWSPQLRVSVMNAKDVAFLLLCLVPLLAVLVSDRARRGSSVRISWPR